MRLFLAVLSFLLSAPAVAADYTQAPPSDPAKRDAAALLSFHHDLSSDTGMFWKLIRNTDSSEYWFSRSSVHLLMDINTPTLHKRYVDVRVFNKHTTDEPMRVLISALLIS